MVTSLREALETHGELLHSRLGSLVSMEDPFVARNDAAWSDGVLIHVPSGVRVSSRSGSSSASSSRARRSTGAP